MKILGIKFAQGIGFWIGYDDINNEIGILLPLCVVIISKAEY